ncbi:AMP deaminase [Blomia tropicalis]|nr:AMP deaminase [Blomia tropicalis]
MYRKKLRSNIEVNSAWETMLDLVNCRVLNVISNENTIAYLLSESSMFIFKNCVMIKTCGSTTLLHCLEKLLELVKMAGFEMIEDLFYSHKNLLVPSLQIQPHHSFLKESEYLDKLFNGQSHLFGHVNSDRFYLYTLNNKYRETNGNEHFKFEIIMEELDEKVMSLFVRPQPNGIMNESITASDVTRKSGIDKLIPEMVIDDYFFTPCGYSMNGLFGPYYMTIHITPESDFSYVSLEMNVPQSDYPKFIRSVLNVFKPGKFMLNLTTPDLSVITARRPNKGLYIVDDHHQPKMDQSNDSIPFIDNVHGLMLYEDLMVATFTDYRRVDLQLSHYKHSDIIYARYVIEVVFEILIF